MSFDVYIVVSCRYVDSITIYTMHLWHTDKMLHEHVFFRIILMNKIMASFSKQNVRMHYLYYFLRFFLNHCFLRQNAFNLTQSNL